MSKLKAFKDSKRCSPADKPTPGDLCIFSPAFPLHQGEFVEDKRRTTFIYPHIVPRRFVRVIRCTRNLVVVNFIDDKGRRVERSDLVSPEFLLSMELTKAGAKLFSNVLRRIE